MRVRNLILLTVAVFCLVPTGQAQSFHVNKVLDNGPAGEKLVFAIVGDGYAAGDQAKCTDDVARLVLKNLKSQGLVKEQVKVGNESSRKRSNDRYKTNTIQ